jgi:hypothetical protein
MPSSRIVRRSRSSPGARPRAGSGGFRAAARIGFTRVFAGIDLALALAAFAFSGVALETFALTAFLAPDA